MEASKEDQPGPSRFSAASLLNPKSMHLQNGDDPPSTSASDAHAILSSFTTSTVIAATENDAPSLMDKSSLVESDMNDSAPPGASEATHFTMKSIGSEEYMPQPPRISDHTDASEDHLPHSSAQNSGSATTVASEDPAYEFHLNTDPVSSENHLLSSSLFSFESTPALMLDNNSHLPVDSEEHVSSSPLLKNELASTNLPENSTHMSSDFEGRQRISSPKPAASQLPMTRSPANGVQRLSLQSADPAFGGPVPTMTAIEPTFVFGSAVPDLDEDGDVGSSWGQGKMLEQAHNVLGRSDRPYKKLKINHENEEGNPKNSFHGESDGIVGGYLREKRKENEADSGTQMAEDNSQAYTAAEMITGPMMTTNTPTANRDLVDLTGDDDEVTFMGPTSEEDKEVCYGQIDKARVNVHTIPHPKDHKGITDNGKQWKSMNCTIFREPLRHFVIHVKDPLNGSFGTVDMRVARALAPLLDSPVMKLRVEARLPPRTRSPNDFIGKEISDYWVLVLNLYGPKKFATAIGKALSQKNVWLSTPYGVRFGREIYNPHVIDRQAISRSKWASKAAPGNQYVTRTNEEITNDISSIFNSLKSSEELPMMEADQRVKTPLLEHQKQALHFMISREGGRGVNDEEDPAKNNPLWRMRIGANGRKTYYNVITGNEQPHMPQPVLGGILADQMGLGKTLEAIVLIVSTLEQAQKWEKEADAETSDQGVPLQNVKSTLLICPKNVTSEWHDQIAMHLKAKSLKLYFYHGNSRCQDIDVLCENDIVLTTYSIVANELKRGSRKKGQSIFATTNWFRIVLDEAHMIREQSTLQSKAICSLPASRRWALTGTPVQNRLEDLGALIKFLRIKPFDEPSAFVQYITTSFKMKDEGALPKLRLLVDSFTLRRLKDKIGLPPREDNIVTLDFGEDEAALHNWFATDAGNKVRVMETRKKGLTGKSYQHVLRSILCLRLISVHGRELLHDDDLQMIQGVSANTAIDIESISEDMPALSPRYAYEMLMLMDSANRQICNSCAKAVRPKEIDDDKDEVFGAMLPCCDVVCNDCIKGLKKSIEANNETGRFVCPFCEVSQRISYFELTQAGVEEAEAERERLKLNPKQAKILGRYRGPHTKTCALISHLKESEEESKALPTDEPPIKSVIFTEWTSHLDLIEMAFEDLMPDMKYVRFDGKMSVKQQAAALSSFKTDDSITVILVSIRAGGVGLNLTTASRVYVMEPQWNPAAEAQAVDRVHRLGQKRPVKIVRFIMGQSIEETMLKLQGKKKRMAEVSLNRNMSKGATVENMEEFKELFSRRL